MKEANKNISTLGSRISAHRIALKMTQIELANKCGISRSSLSNYENDTKLPNSDVIIALSKELDLSLNYLLLGYDDETRIYAEFDVSGLSDEKIACIKRIIDFMKPDFTKRK
jgi:transcriptional regulator with XRE-family HTH domain